MRRSSIHRLPAKLATLLAILAMGVVQPMLSACTCGVAALPQETATELAPAAPPCCCSHECGKAAVEIQCDAVACGADGCEDYACSVSSAEYPLQTSSNSTLADDAPTHIVYIPAAALTANIGLHGADWHNAFDLTSLGGSPGIRRHALLSVWRI